MDSITPNNINISENIVSPSVKNEYIMASKSNANVGINKRDMPDRTYTIFDLNAPAETKKNILVQLAATNNVDAYRVIEKYLLNPMSGHLYEWATLALQECKLKLQSDLLEEKQVLISTGLGGKGKKLRYFMVFFTKDGSEITSLQEKIIRKELGYRLDNTEIEIEDLLFEDNVASILTMIPFDVAIKKTFMDIIMACNQIGEFLFEDLIITNIKVLSTDEIKELLILNNIYI